MSIMEEQQQLIVQIEHEKELSKQSLIDIEKHWKKVLSEEKLDSLKKEVTKIRRRCDGEVKQKKDTIQELLSSFIQAEDQFRMSVATHLQVVDEMIQTHDAVICKIERDFHESLDTHRKDYETERQRMTEKFESDKDRIMNEIMSMELEEKRLVDENNREQQQVIEEIKNKNQEEENSLKITLDTKIEDLDEQFELAKNEYLQKTDTQSKALEKQLEKDKEMSKELLNLQNQIDRLCSSIKRLKSVTRRNSSQNMEANNRLMLRKNRVISRYKDTNVQLENLRSCQHDKLKKLTNQANSQKSELEKEFHLIERILKLIHLTKKKEIEQSRENGEQPIIIKETFNPEGIWTMYNKTLVDMRILEDAEKGLLQKNMQLKQKLRQFQDGVTVNDRVINNYNPLLVINGKMRPESRDCLSKYSKSDPSVGLAVIDHFSLPLGNTGHR